ncbi:MAG TPA: 16S rRNA (cytosine(1402)-N(4))-methyltransferase RsmH [Acidobacteriota bacterium]|jgi:16S rRNA (cytosine1402-N4)-methyltransferase
MITVARVQTPASPLRLPWPQEVDARTTMEPGQIHRPVMVDEVLDYLEASGGLVIDATVGGGGHSAAILAACPDCMVIGLDRDSETLDVARRRLEPWKSRVELLNADYRNLPQLAFERRWWPVRGIVADLGVSSLQLDSAERGFSFRRSGPLDMRMDRTRALTAADLIHELDADELASILRRYGEERYAGPIARAIVAARGRSRLRTTDQLAEVVSAAVPRAPAHIHAATRTFQALRIAVNDELSGLYEFAIGATRLLAPGGRLVVITFHSLEDRLVKQAFQYLASDCVCPPKLPRCACNKFTEVEILTKRPLRPGPNEVEVNPRSRSAHLRALVRP